VSETKKSKQTRIHPHNNPLSEQTRTETRAAPASAGARSLPRGMVRHILKLQPATGFEYRYQSSAGDARIIHLERGALESGIGSPSEVSSFRAGVSPGERPTSGGFFTSPDSIPMSAEATILIEAGVSGDSIICRSFGSFDGLSVTLTIFRENEDGSISRILQENIQDANEHTFPIP
jgi:hypothetical protein